jgi:hypothetical protein
MKKSVLILMMLCAFAFAVSCGNQPSAESPVMEKNEVLNAIAPVNESIVKFADIRSGTITAEYTGSARPANIAVKNELTFERTEKGAIHYNAVETYYDNREPLKIDKTVDDGVLPDPLYFGYPKSAIDPYEFGDVRDVVVTQGDDSTTYQVNWLNDNPTASEGIFYDKAYSTYTIDKNGVLTEIYYYYSYYSEKDGKKETSGESSQRVSLTNYAL